MRVATFNLESLDLPPKAGIPIEARIAVLRPQLQRLEADILCLQEVNGQHLEGQTERKLLALDMLLDRTPYAGFARAVSSSTAAHGVADVHNLVTLSRWPITQVRSVHNDLVPALSYRMLTADPPSVAPSAIAFDRPYLACDIALPGGQTITVINVHLRAPLAMPIPGQKSAPFVWKSTAAWAEGYVLSAWKRAAQALEARIDIDRLLDEDEGRMILVAGDFNAEDHETPLKILVGADEDTGNGLLAPRALTVLDRGLPQDRRFSTLHHGRPQMLDHILVSPAVLGHFRGIEVHNETLGDELVGFGRTRNIAGSYHAPVVAAFGIS